MIKTQFAFIISLILLLSGCTGMKKSPTKSVSTNVKADTASPSRELTEASVSVSRSLSELAAMERAALPPGRLGPVAEIPGTVSVDWAGPVEPLLLQIAKISQYRLRVLGVRPAIPVMITMNVKDIPLTTVVRDIDFQSVKKASVIVYPQTRIIELRYMRS
jgi:defect in organelle trafficking protein DotD